MIGHKVKTVKYGLRNLELFVDMGKGTDRKRE